MAHFSSKHGIVNRSQAELYMAFTDMSNFTRFVPEDKRADVTADYDSLFVKAQGMNIGGRVSEREPYHLIAIRGEGAPFDFSASLHFDQPSTPGSTDFHIEVEADLNFMMKMMLGNRLQEALDTMVDGLVDVSNGKIPDGVPPEYMNNFKV